MITNDSNSSEKLDPSHQDTSETPVYSPWYLRYIMLIAFLILTVSLMDRYIVSILLDQIGRDLSLTDTQLGWLVGPAFVVVHVLFQLPLARLADRTVRRTLIAGAMALWSLFTIAAGFAKTFPQLLGARMGVGITEAACSPPLASLLSDYFPPARRARAMSMLSVGGTAGIGAGMLLGGYLGQEYGWRVALIVAGIPGLVLSLVVWLTVKEPVRGGMDGIKPGTPQVQVGLWRTVRTLVNKRTFVWLLIGASLSFVTSIGRGAWEPVFLIRVYGLDQAAAGLVYFLISPLPAVVGAIAGGLLADRLAARDLRWYMWFPALATIVTFPLVVAFLLWPVDDTLFGDMLPIGFLFSIAGSVIGAMASPATIAAGQTLSPPAMRATTHALWTMGANLVGMGLGPVLVGMLSHTFAPTYGDESIRYAMVIVSAIAVPASLALFLGARSVKKDFVVTTQNVA